MRQAAQKGYIPIKMHGRRVEYASQRQHKNRDMIIEDRAKQ